MREDYEENKTDIKNESTKDNCNKVTATSNEEKYTKVEENKLEMNDVQMKPVDSSEIDTNNKQEDRRVIEVLFYRRRKEDKECKEKQSCLKKIIDYFKEFVDNLKVSLCAWMCVCVRVCVYVCMCVPEIMQLWECVNCIAYSMSFTSAGTNSQWFNFNIGTVILTANAGNAIV